MDAIDELCTGTPSLAAPSIRSELGAGYSSLALLLLAVPLASCLVLEPALIVWASRRGRERGVAWALGAQGLAFVGSACAREPWTLLIGLSAAMLATSVACALAQARLIELHPNEPERVLTRWTFLGGLGDLATPVLVAGMQRWQGGFRGAFLCCAALCLVHAFIVSRAGCSAPTAHRSQAEEDEQRPPLTAAVRKLLAQPGLVPWAVGTVLCNLLDETLIVFGALQLRERRGFDEATTDLLLFALALGSTLGIVAADRLVARRSPLRLLALSCATCVIAYTVWLQLEAAWASALALFIVGLAIGPQFPLAQAQCYRRARDEPVLVSVIEGWLEPIHVVMPWLLGLVAERLGLGWTLSLLLLQPLSLLLCCALARRERAATEL